MSLGNSQIINNRVDKVFISYVNIGDIYIDNRMWNKAIM